MSAPDLKPAPAARPAGFGTERPSMRELLAALEADRAAMRDEARPAAVARQRDRAEHTARERIAMLVDPGSFREFGELAREAGEPAGEKPGDGVVAGAAKVEGRPVNVVAQDFTVMGGSSGEIGSRKMQQALRRSVREGAPLALLLDGGGHRIQIGQNSRRYAPSTGLFQDLARLSGWAPMCAAMLGAGFAAPTNFSGLADLVTMVRGQSFMGLAGPALVKAGTGEDIDAQTLGGAEAQVDRNGIADLGCADEAEAIGALRRFLGYLPTNAGQPAPVREAPPEDPARDEALLDLVPSNTRRAYDMRKVVNLIADPDSVFELKPTYARNVLTSFARIRGRPVGIVANQPMSMGGMLTGPACDKAARFVSMCDAFGLPLVYLIDVPGFSIGSAAEKGQLGRRSAKLIQELGHATVPRVSVVLRKGYGLGYVAMAGGRSFEADAAYAWPTAEICAMSIEGAVQVVNARKLAAAEDPDAMRAGLIAAMRAEVTPFGGAEGFGLDDIIDPRKTRACIAETLERAPARRDIGMPPKFRAITPI
ncbi:MAG: carboxyl transferase domain-containing protein [Pseudomonadota bacterium]|nr:carboxyl transferase domain-containing protein [Pseudomonadota bacterium]